MCKQKLLNSLYDMVYQNCYIKEDDIFDSMAVSSYADAILLLADHDMLTIEHHVMRRVIAKNKVNDEINIDPNHISIKSDLLLNKINKDIDNLYVVSHTKRGCIIAYEVARKMRGHSVLIDYNKLELNNILDIPDNASVLFVEHSINSGDELNQLILSVARHIPRSHTTPGTKFNYITQILCINNCLDNFDMPSGPHQGEWEIISLDKE